MPASKRPKAGQLEPAEEGALLELVDYAEGGIVSRTILEGEGGSVTVFAFDAGQSLSEHTAPFDALVQVIDGKAHLHIGGRRVCATAGQIVLMPANVPHAVEAPERFKMMLTMLRSA